MAQVTCGKCGHQSRTTEPFTDLSLEFPDRYQYRGGGTPVSSEPCHVTEMLAKFTEVEHLEGEIYACAQCNSTLSKRLHRPVLTRRRRRVLATKSCIDC